MAGVTVQSVEKITGGLQINRIELLVQFAALPVFFVFGLRDGHAGSFGQHANSLRIAELLDIHNEMDNISAFVAAKAIVNLFGRRYAK